MKTPNFERINFMAEGLFKLAVCVFMIATIYKEHMFYRQLQTLEKKVEQHEPVKLSDGISSSSIAAVDENAYLLVKGIEGWIDMLVPVAEEHGATHGLYLKMKDPKTGAKFEIRRIK